VNLEPVIKVSGTTKPFSGYGRKLGYPTANIETNLDIEDGVYFGSATLGESKQKAAMIFIGVPNTVGDKDRRLEVYLFNVEDKDYYNLKLDVSIEYFHRKNLKLESLDELVDIMKDDEKTAREWFSGKGINL
jgi:riboflavin kinase/FMN adenylyltransferase